MGICSSSFVKKIENLIEKGRKKYPWSGQYTRSGERQILGDQLANFKNSDGDYGGIAGWSEDRMQV